MVLPVLALKLLTIANITLERQSLHDSLTKRNNWENSYDFIVVGGGTAGSIVASRLSENPNWKVLLLEAGFQENPISDIPLLYPLVPGDPANDWGYRTVPQKQVCQNEPNKGCRLERGKFLGGCSSHNGMAQLRGVARNFDNWVTQYGLKGWSYEEVLPFFKRSENQTNIDILKKFSPYHGTGGPLTQTTNKRLELDMDWINAQIKVGYKYVIDANSPEWTARTVAPVQQTIRDGHRLSTSAAYLEPNRNRTNLHILTGSQATKILFNDPKNSKKTTGIEFFKEGKKYTVNVTKEIILSGGAINSPQLLMLSGIGPKAHLESLGIKILVDLPVGQNFQDSSYSFFEFKGPNGFFPKNSTLESEILGIVNTENLYQFYKYGTGPLSMFNVEYSLFNTKYNNDSKDWPDSGFEAGSRPMSDGKNVFYTFYVVLEVQRPESRGFIRLNSSDPFDHPLIDPNYLSHPSDLNVLVEAFKELHSIVKSSPKFKDLYDFETNCTKCNNASIFDEIPCDEFIKCISKERFLPPLHLTSSCPMGSDNDPKSVVDSSLKVRHVEGLRVIDASVMPQTIEPGTYAPTVMIGEKGSQLIKDDHKFSSFQFV